MTTPDETAATADEASDAAEATGVRAADDARSRLADLDEASLEEHLDINEDVHRRLHEGLADLDES
jgi:hypothetical protein